MSGKSSHRRPASVPAERPSGPGICPECGHPWDDHEPKLSIIQHTLAGDVPIETGATRCLRRSGHGLCLCPAPRPPGLTRTKR